MKYSTIVIAALLGFAQAVTIKDIEASGETDIDDGAEGRRRVASKPEPKKKQPKMQPKSFPKFDESSDDEPWPANNMNNGFSGKDFDLDVNGKGMIVEGEAAASSNQGQAIKILPDTQTRTAGVSSCWGKNTESEDGTNSSNSFKDFRIAGKIVVKEDTDTVVWKKSSGSSDGSAQKEGEQGVQVDDSDYQGKLGSLKSTSCAVDSITDFH